MSAAAVFVAATTVALFFDAGPHARHMGYHVIAMNIIAPTIAGIAIARWGARETRSSWLWIATISQIAAVWISHAPPIQAAAMAFSSIQIAMHGLLLASALCFWILVLSLPQVRHWHALAALLLTGKLVCLLGALLVFAPRALYGTGRHHGPLVATLDDQQLAGLLMIVACPLSYLLAAVVITVRLLNRSEATDAMLRHPARGAG